MLHVLKIDKEYRSQVTPHHGRRCQGTSPVKVRRGLRREIAGHECERVFQFFPSPAVPENVVAVTFQKKDLRWASPLVLRPMGIVIRLGGILYHKARNCRRPSM